ncbi:MAG: FAD binding domain-containing protein [Mitsuaria chitosanitabida]|uniref:FAD binding domain-containing protein n=1 Tax=Roseateles chitosanitabidus TaxID=65048 RepID=UPI001B20DE8A|nr:FAD binding domain-containing protein [Roseateles chitosanitabidus]MBO9687129.1 FAD binding domain-containing protein [Roseateles chitosanitabidus]
MNYLRANTLDEALAELARLPRRVICGGTDVYADPAAPVAASAWLDIGRVEALRDIALVGGQLRIGAAVTWEALARSPLTPTVLREAADQVGSRQIRVQGSLGGNLCHASPIADGVPPLLALDAQVELASTAGSRRLRLDEFLLGRRRTALRPDELLTAVLVPVPVPAESASPVAASRVAAPPLAGSPAAASPVATSLLAATPLAASPSTERGAFIKCANRDGTALAVVSAALLLRWNDRGLPARAAIAIGGASDVPVRLRGLEALFEGIRPADLPRLIRETPLPELAPIDDHRGSAALRRHLVRVAIERALARVLAPCPPEVAHAAAF